MAVINPYKPYVYNRNRILPANFYARPAVQPYFQGLNGFGQARRNATQQFEYTLQQMAASPFAVNNRAYMDRIRDEYGYDNSNAYDVMGMTGAVVGGGVGVLLRSGYLQNPLTYAGKLLEPKTWAKFGIQNPWKPDGSPLDPKVWKENYNNKFATQKQNRFIRQSIRRDGLLDYNRLLNESKDLKNALQQAEEAKTAANKALDEAKDAYDKVKYQRWSKKKGQPVQKMAAKRKLLQAEVDVRKADDALISTQKLVTKNSDELVDAGKFAKTVDKSKAVAKAVDSGAEIGTKTLGFLPGVASIGLDAAGVAMDIAAFKMAQEADDKLMMALSGIGAVAGSIDIIGGVVSTIGASILAGSGIAAATVIGAPAAFVGAVAGAGMLIYGEAISAIAGVVSLGMSAITGGLVGLSIGRSMSPEGARAQQLYAQNLYSGMINRPITTVATLGTLVATPVILGAMGAKRDRGIAAWLSNSALGNQVRAGMNMGMLQLTGAITGPLDDKLVPQDPNNVNFVSAISLYGDINDNLYGATKNKAILVGLVSGDENKMVEAMARSWGYSDDIYRSVMFDDIRQEAGIELGGLGNSLVSILGELIIDPQNLFEMDMKASREMLSKLAAEDIVRGVEMENIARAAGKYGEFTQAYKGLTGEGGLLGKGSMDHVSKVRLVKQLLEAYLTGGRDGLVKKLSDSSQKKYGGAGRKGGGEVTEVYTKGYVNDLVNVFRKALTGETIYFNTNILLRQRIRDEYKKYQELQTKDPATYTQNDIDFMKRVKNTGDMLEKHYGEEATDVLFDKFARDLDITIGRKEYNALYATNTRMQYHMDMSDAAAGIVTSLSNPMLKLAQGGTEGFRKFMERTRMFTSKQKSKTIDGVKQLKEERSKKLMVKRSEVEEAKRVEEEKYKQRNKDLSLNDLFEYEYEDSEARKKQRREFAAEMEKNKQEYEARQTQHDLAIKHYTDEIERLDNDRKESIYWGRNYKSKRGNNYTISDKNLSEHEKLLVELGESLGIDKNMSYDEIEARLQQLRRSGIDDTIDAANKYADLRDAIVDYQYVHIYYTVVKDFLVELKTGLTLLDMPSIEAENRMYDLMTLKHIFHQLSNSTRTIKYSKQLIGIRKGLRSRITKLTKRIIDTKKKLQEFEQTIAEETVRKQADPKAEDLMTPKQYEELNNKAMDLRKQLTKDQELIDKYKKERSEISSTLSRIGQGLEADTDVVTSDFDVENYLLFKSDEKITALDRVLMYYGFELTVEQNGVPIQVRSLKEIAANKMQLSAPIQLKRTINIDQVIQSHILSLVPGYDINTLMQGLFKMPDDFVGRWRSWNQKPNELSRKNDLLMELISKMGLTEDQQAFLLSDAEGLIALRASIDRFTSQGDTYEDYIQQGLLDRRTVRAIVMTEMLKKENAQSGLISAALEHFRNAGKFVDDLKKTSAYKNSEYLEAVVNRQVSVMNILMHNNLGFQFLKAYLSPRTQKDVNTGLFLSGQLDEDLPMQLWKQHKERLKKDTRDYAVKDDLVNFAESTLVKEFVERQREHFERSKRIRNTRKKDDEGNIIRTEDSIEVQQEVAAIKERREENKARVDKIKNNTTKDASEQTGGVFDKIKEEDTEIISMESDMGTDRAFKLPLMKSIQNDLGYGNVKRLTKAMKMEIISAFITRALTKDELVDLQLDQIILSLTPTQYVYGDEQGKRSYFNVLKKLSRTSPGHTAYVTRTSKKIVNIIKRFGGTIEFKNNKLVIDGGPFKFDLKHMDTPKRYSYETAEGYLVRVLTRTYLKNKDGVRLFVRLAKNKRWTQNYKNLTSAYKTALRKAVIKWMVANDKHPLVAGSDFDPNTFDYTKESIDRFIEKITTSDDPAHVGIRNKIYDYSAEEYDSLIQDNYYDKMFYKMLPFINALRDYEQRDIKELTGHHRVTANDVFNKMMAANTKMVDVLDDIIMMAGDIEDPEYKTMLMELVRSYNKYINENYSHKRFIKNTVFDNIRVIEPTANKDTEIFFKNKTTGKEISLYDLLYKYDKNMTDVLNILKYATASMASRGNTESTLVDIRLKVLNQYETLLETHEGVLTRNTFDLKQEVFFNIKNKDGRQKYNMRQFELMNDPLLNRAYQLLRTKHLLPTNKTDGGKEYTRMKFYLNKEVANLLIRADKMKGDLDVNFLRLILNSKLSDFRKKTILKDIFFYEHKIQAVYATQKNIREETIKRDKATTDRGRRIAQKKLDTYDKIRENIINKEYEDFDKFYEYLLSDHDRAVEIYASKISLSNGDYAVVEHNGKYYAVDNKNKHNKYVDEDSLKGLPPHNEDLGERVLKDNDEDRSKRVEDAIKNNTELPDLKVGASSKWGTIFIVDTPGKYSDEVSKFYKEMNFSSEFGGKIFFMTAKQLTQLKAMAKDSEYKDDFIFKPVLKNGEVQGQVFNMLGGYKGKNKLANAYISDLRTITRAVTEGGKKYTIDKFVDKLQGFAKIYEEDPIVKRGFVSSVAFDKTDTFLRMVKDARLNKAYLEFLHHIDPTKKFDKFNLYLLERIFFQERFITTKKTGKLFDLSKLEKELSTNLKNRQLIKQMKDIKINGKDLFTRTTEALRMLQEKYGENKDNIQFNIHNVMRQEFIKDVQELKRKVASILTSIKTRHRDAYKLLLPLLNKHVEKGLISGITVPEVQERNRLYKELLSDFINEKNQYLLIDPYTPQADAEGVRSYDERDKILQKMLEGFNSRDGKNQTYIKDIADKLRSKFRSYASYFNRQKLKTKSDKLDLALFWKLHKQIRRGGMGSIEGLKLKSSKRFTEMSLRYFKEYKETLDELASGRLDPESQTYIQGEVDRFHERLGVTELKTASDLENILMRRYLGLIHRNITNRVQRVNYQDAMLEIVMRHANTPYNSEAERQAAMTKEMSQVGESLKNWKPRLNYDESQRKLTQIYKNAKGEGEVSEWFIEDIANKRFFRFLNLTADDPDASYKEMNELLIDIQQDYMDILYNRTNSLAKHELYLQATLKEEVEEHLNKEINPGTTVQDYLKSIPPEELDQQTAWFFVKYFVLKQGEPTEEDWANVSKRLDELESMRGADTPTDTKELYLSEDHLKNIRSILRGETSSKRTNNFETPKELFDKLNTPLLYKDQEFYKYLMNYFFKDGVSQNKITNFLSNFGLKFKDKHLFETSKSLYELIPTLSQHWYKQGKTKGVEYMYLFTMISNTVKEQYYRKEVFNRNRFTWKQAHKYSEDRPIEDAVDAVKTLEYSGAFSKHEIFESNVQAKLNNDLAFIGESLAFIKNTNKKLYAIIIPDGTKVDDQYDMKPKYVLVTETRIEGLIRGEERDLYKSLFKTETTMAPSSVEYNEYLRVLADAQHDSVVEDYADNVNSVGSRSALYNELRKLFDSAMTQARNKHGAKEFVKMKGIAGSWKALEGNKDLVAVYKALLHKYMATITQNRSARKVNFNRKVQEIVDFINQKGYMKDTDSDFIEAVLGRILHQRFQIKGINIDEVTKEAFDLHLKQVEVSKDLAIQRSGKISTQLQAAGSNIEEVKKILYGDRELSAEEQTFLESTLALKQLMENDLSIDPDRMYDTYDYGYFEDVDAAFEDTTIGRQYADTYGSYRALASRRGGRVRTYNNYTRKHNMTPLKAVRRYNKAKQLEGEVTQRLETLAEDILKAEADVTNTKTQALLRIIESNPTIMNNVLIEMQTKRDEIEAKIKKLRKDFTKPTKYGNEIDEKLINYFHDYTAKRLEYLEFRESHSYDVYLRVLQDKEGNKSYADILKDNKFDLSEIGIKNTKALATWMKKSADLFAYKETIVDNKTHHILDSDGKRLAHVQVFKELFERHGKIVYEETGLKAFDEKIPGALNDFETNTKLYYARKYIGLILKDYKASITQQLKHVFAKEGYELTDDNKAYVKEKAEDGIKKQQEITKKYQGILKKKYGLSINLRKLETTIGDAVDNHRLMKGITGDDKYIKELKKIKKIITRAQEYIKHNKSVIKGLGKAESVTLRSQMLNATKEVFTKNGLDYKEENLETILKYLSGAETEEVNTHLKGLKDEQAVAEAELSDAQTLANELDAYIKLPNEIEELTKQRDEKKVLASELRTKYNKAKDEQAKAKPHGNSNIGMFKNLYEIETDERALQQVIELTVNSGAISRNKLLRLIKEAGYSEEAEVKLHNPVVDVLFTRLNYIKQLENRGEQVPKSFTVFDIETVRQYNGKNLPYQMTILKQTDGKLEVFNGFFNNFIFNQEKTETELKGFYDQQYDMLKDEPRFEHMTSEEARKVIDKETDAIIKKVTKTKNSVAIVNVFINLMNTVRVKKDAQGNVIKDAEADPLIAHWGTRFDFNVYEDFLKDYSKRLLTNMYYQEGNKSTPEELAERLTGTTIGKAVQQGWSEELTRLYTDEIDVILRKLMSTDEGGKWVEVTKAERDKLAKFNEAMWSLQALQVWNELEYKYGWTVNEELKQALLTGEDSEAMWVRDLVGKYLKADTNGAKDIRNKLANYFLDGFKIESSQEQTPEIYRFVDDFLDAVSKRYNALLEGEQNIDYNNLRGGYKSQYDKALEASGGPVIEKANFSAKERYDGYETMITELTTMIDSVKGTDFASKDTVSYLTARVDENKALRDTYSDRIVDIQKDIAKGETKRSTILDELHGLSQEIHKVMSLPAYRANMILSNNVDGAMEMYGDVYEHQYHSGMLRVEIKQQLDELNRIYKELITLIDLAKQAEASDTKTTLQQIVDQREVHRNVLKIDSEEARVKVIEDFKKKQKTLAQYIVMLSKNEIDSSHLFAKYLQTIIDDFRKNSDSAIKDIAAEIEKLWNDPKTKILFSKDKKYAQYEKITIKDPRNQNLYNQLHKIVRFNKRKRNSAHFKKLNILLNSRSQIRTLIDMETKNIEDLTKMKNVKSLLHHAILKDINRYTRYIGQAESVSLDKRDVEHIAYKGIEEKFLELMEAVDNVDKAKAEINRKDLFNLLSNKGISSEEMSYGEFRDAASTEMDKSYLESLHNPNIKRAYENPLRNDDKMALVMREDLVYATERETSNGKIITVTVYDQYNDDIHQFSFNTKKPNQVTFKIRYNYRQYGQEFTNKKPKEFTVKTWTRGTKISTDPRALYENLFKKSGVAPNETGIPGLLKSEIYKEDGLTDHSYKAFERLVNFYEDVTTNKRVNLSKLNRKVVYDRGKNGLSLRHLELKNMTEKFEKQFHAYLSTVQDMQRQGNFKNVIDVYNGISQKLLGKFNKMEPGKILNLIPGEYSRAFIIDYTEDELDAKGIDLLRSSEGSAGVSFMTRNKYTASIAFRHNTNPIRSVLSNNKGYADFSALKIVNDMYTLEDNSSVERENFMDYANWKEGSLEHDYFIETTKDGKRIDMFTPNVGTKDMLQKYKDDILHRKGFNVKIAFSNDTRAYEDTILVDAELARAFGYSEHDKTWLSQYGFKGAVKFVEGLRNDYNGAMFVARAPSIQDRGAFGALDEMAVNVIRNYLNDNTSKIEPAVLKILKKHKETLEKAFPLMDGKVIIDENTDVDKKLTDIFGNDWYKLLLKNDKKFTTDFRLSGGKMSDPIEVNGFYEGEVYVILDSEHVASHMATKADIDETGQIATVLRDLGGSVRHGVNLSPSVAMALESKGIKWREAFAPDDRTIKLYAEVSNFGLRKLIDQYSENNTLSEADTLKAMEDLPASNLMKIVQDYLFWYKKLTEDNTEKQKSYINYNLARLSNQAKQQALESSYGREGSLYKATYRKHPGIREQLVADSTLGLGEIRISRPRYEALMKMESRFLEQEAMDADSWQEITGVKDINETKKFNTKEEVDAYVYKLGKFGIIKGHNYELKNKVFTFKNMTQSVGYVMAARSPVQDYNAVPVVKVVGFNTGEATEANVYMYSMMGADNDGDTIGMFALNKFKLDVLAPMVNGKRRGLMATNKEYYDDGYLEDIEADMKDLDRDGNKKDLATFDDRSAIAAFVGKRTFDQIRKKYTWNELYILTYDGIKDHIDNMNIKGVNHAFKFMDAKESTVINRLKTNSSHMSLIKKWVNVMVRYETNGENYNTRLKTKDDYDDPKLLYKEFMKHRDEIIKRSLFDNLVLGDKFDISPYISSDDVANYSKYLDEDTRSELEELGTTKLVKSAHKDIIDKIAFNKLYARVLHNTVKRIQTSKRGIDTFGGNRKKQLISAYLSDFYHINQDKDGEVWKDYRNKKGELLVESVATKLLGMDSEAVLKLVDTISGSETDVTKRYRKKYIMKFMQAFTKPGDLDPLIDKDYDKLMEFIYKQYVNASQVTKELVPVASAVHRGDIKELVTLIENSDKMNDVNIQQMVLRWKAELEEGKIGTTKILTDVDREWLMAAYFGRNRADAYKVFEDGKMWNKDTLTKNVMKYAEGYYKQHIIDRKRLGVMSHEATKIIAVAKHFGIDTNAVEFITNFTKKLEDISNEINVRKVIMGDDYALGTAIAMDAKVFENNSIRHMDETVKDMRDAYKEKYKIENFIVDPRTVRMGHSSATNHVKNLVLSSGKVELFGDPFIPDRYFNEVMDAIQNMFNVLNRTRDVYKLNGKDEDSITLKESVRVLTQYGIPSYRVMRVLLNSVATFRRVNTIYYSSYNKSLSFKDVPFLKNSMGFYETVTNLYDKQKYETFKNSFTENKLVSDFFLNTLEVDPGLLVDGKRLESDEIDYSNLILKRSRTQEQMQNLHKDLIDEDVDYENNIKLNQLEEHMAKRALNKLGLLGTEHVPNMRDTLTSLTKQFAAINNMYEFKMDQMKDNKFKYKTRESIENDLVTKGVFNTARMVGSIDKLTERNNKYKDLIIERDRLIAERVKLDTKLIGLESEIEKFTGQRQYFEQYQDKQALITDLETLRDEYVDKKEVLEEQMLAYAFNKEFKGTILLHTKEGKNIRDYYFTRPAELYKTIDEESIEEVKNANVLNMDKYQQPFLQKSGFFVKEQYANSQYVTADMIDWDLFYDWYGTQTRFHRLTVAMKAMPEETLLKQLNDIITKEDLEFEKLDASKRKKIRYITRSYRKSRFKTKQDLIEFMKQLEIDVALKEKLETVSDMAQFNRVMSGIDRSKYSKKFRGALLQVWDQESLNKFKEELTAGKIVTRLKMNGVTFDKMDFSKDQEDKYAILNRGDYLSPTLKEIDIRSAEDLRTVFEFIKESGDEYQIGFTDLDSWMTGMEQAYKPFRLEGFLSEAVIYLQYAQKLLMRLNPAFLVRNEVDTWVQIFSETYVQKGAWGTAMNARTIANYVGSTHRIYALYKEINEELLLSKMDSNLRYQDIGKLLDKRTPGTIEMDDVKTIETLVGTLRDRVYLYVNSDVDKVDLSRRIEARKKSGEKLLKRLDDTLNYITNHVLNKASNAHRIYNIRHRKDIKQAVTFLMNIRFAEYYTMYDDLRIDPSTTRSKQTIVNSAVDWWNARHDRRIKKLEKKEREKQTFGSEDFRHILFEISAFMNTQAQVDLYKQETYKYIYEGVALQKYKDVDDTTDLGYNELLTVIAQAKNSVVGDFINLFKGPIGWKTVANSALFPVKAGVKSAMNLYEGLNSDIENIGRVAGYLFDRHMYGYTFEESVNRSLRRFFNYGQRNATEMRMMADIPYLSFPIRSIDNWIDRMHNPNYLRMMSDIMDGAYGQYADEDGQYDEYTKFQMANGWLPLWGGVGIRLGWGALDLQALLSDTSGEIAQRTNPLLRGLSKYMQTKDVTESLKQLATVGALSKAVTAIAPREQVRGTMFTKDKPRSLHSSVGFLYEFNQYGKYTPYKYRNQNNNARYKRYENIYKNWFNKYGQMRKPPVDPLSMVKDIQWKQYVRYRRNNNMFQ